MSGQSAAPAYSPVVLAGLVRAIEFAIIVSTGLLVHFLYVVPMSGYSLEYYVAISAIAAASILIFQILDINQVAAFRTPIYQTFRLAGGWALVFLAAL